jgi:hypothetical protein
MESSGYPSIEGELLENGNDGVLDFVACRKPLGEENGI